ncbi:hypothetical protein AALP_AA2G002100, partial [Arabis alpina]
MLCGLSISPIIGLSNSIRAYLRTGYTNQWTQVLELISDSRQSKVELFLVRYAFQTAVHGIWRERNYRNHGGQPNPPSRLIQHMDKQVRNRLSSLRGIAPDLDKVMELCAKLVNDDDDADDLKQLEVLVNETTWFGSESRQTWLSITERAFKRKWFLGVYKRRYDGNDRVDIPEDMEFPPRLRFHWEAYPSKYLPHTFHTEYLVELNMQGIELECLWQGTQLTLKELMSLSISGTLVEEVPPSISMWYSLWFLSVRGTGNLKTITRFHESLWKLDLSYTDIEKIPDCNNGLYGALHSLLSNKFQFNCFVEKLRGSYHHGFDEYGVKMRVKRVISLYLLFYICTIGEFGEAFNETCAGKTDEKRRRWSQALTDAGNIAGEDFKNWDNEAEMIEKMAKDVSQKLHATPSRDFDGMVGLEAHLRKLESLLHLRENLDATPSMIVGICGPAGIGKSTIARALHSLHSNKFQLTCYVENLMESYPGVRDEYSLKLLLQAELLSKILNLKGITISHLCVLQERLQNQRVLIILDDVKNITHLEALANEPTWFGPGSRIVITTENKEILQQHGIKKTYHVGFSRSYLAERVTELCGKLPLGLQVVDSSLRGKNEKEWEGAIRRLDTIFDQKNIEEVLRVGYESLHENEKSLFVHIAVFFNYKDDNIVEALFADGNNNLDIKDGLEILANKSLIDVSSGGEIVMHKLLQQVGTKVVREEEPWKRKILIKAQDIRDVLEDEDDRESKQVSVILFDISRIKEVIINKRAFKRMSKLRFLKVIKSKDDGNDIVHIPEGMELPRRLRFFHWEAYPGKAFPTLNLQNMVELKMPNNQLEKLWEGRLPLANLKKMDLYYSLNLKNLPDFSNATNLESLILNSCTSLEELPSSIGNLHKLEELEMGFCTNLQIVPTHLNLASLDFVNMIWCAKLRKIPEISTNIRQLAIADTMLEESPWLWSGLEDLFIYGNDLDGLNIEKLPDWIKDLHGLKRLYIDGCRNLASLPELPRSLTRLKVIDCESLKTLMVFPLDSQIEELYFPNCFKLTPAARRVITLQASPACLPGRTMHAEFVHRAKGNVLTIRSDFNNFRICAVVSPKELMEVCTLSCLIRLNGCPIEGELVYHVYVLKREHLFTSYASISVEDGWLEQDNEYSLRLLIGEAYPTKCLPPTFHTEYLVQLNMQGSQLEHLWQGTQVSYFNVAMGNKHLLDDISKI